jgi:flagellar biosynthesis chaperone FliJ
MARDPLQILLSMRRRSVEQARYALGACLATEAQAADRIRSLDDTVRRDRETVRAWQDSHQFMEMSALRLDAMLAQRRTLLAEFAMAETRSTQARGVVAAARTAAEAVEQLMGERAVADQAEAAKREQHVLDDIARGRLTLHPRP